MELNKSILSEITVHMKYAKFLKNKFKREDWVEIVDRNKNMHINKFPDLKNEIDSAYKFVYNKQVLPSMRSMQFGGFPIEINPSRVFNCAYIPIDDYHCFSEAMFLLLGGTGVGFSVQKRHIKNLPALEYPSKKTKRFLVPDSIEGWADAIKMLLKSYFFGTYTIDFDFSDIRNKGAELVKTGGKAPGPEPLKICIEKIEDILKLALFERGGVTQLKPIEIHDIMCHIADAVLAGGIRRAALISLFDPSDTDMILAKNGNWWVDNPQRGRANNSATFFRGDLHEKTFKEFMKMVQSTGSGDPGVYLTNDLDYGTNPCCEISLMGYQFCNLVELNASNVNSVDEFIETVKAATFISTLQASYTDFHYLRDIWRVNTEKDALIGVSMTGIASNIVDKYDLELIANKVVKDENSRVANIIGINEAARTTCVKPAGTTSLTLGTSSGIHAWHDDFYIRRLRVNKNEPIYTYLATNHPELVEDEKFSPNTTAVIQVPQKAPEGALTRNDENSIQFLNRVKDIYKRWVKPGHRSGPNTNNVSATVNVKSDEWDSVINWMWLNRNNYNGLSVLPYDGGTYEQAPFESIDENTYLEMSEKLKDINLNNILETSDNTDLQGEIACSGGSCEIS